MRDMSRKKKHRLLSFAELVTVDVAQCETSEQWKMTMIPGCEFSASYPVPAWNGETTEIHIIGLFPDGVDPGEFEDIFANLDKGKQQYVKAILKQLNERGIDITLDEVEAAGIRTGHGTRLQMSSFRKAMREIWMMPLTVISEISRRSISLQPDMRLCSNEGGC